MWCCFFRLLCRSCSSFLYFCWRVSIEVNSSPCRLCLLTKAMTMMQIKTLSFFSLSLPFRCTLNSCAGCFKRFVVRWWWWWWRKRRRTITNNNGWWWSVDNDYVGVGWRWLAGEASKCDVWGLRVNNTVMNTMFTL